MPKVTAFACPHTGKLFALKDENKYKAHLNKLSKNRRTERKIKKERAEFDEWLDAAKARLRTPDEIVQWAAENIRRLDSRHGLWMDTKISKDFKLTSIGIENPRFNASASNTHCAPKGMKTNWHRKVELPNGYPAITGRIFWTWEGRGCEVSRVISAIGINTGSGGGGGTYRYEVTMFLDDWPALKENVEAQQIVAKLKGIPLNAFEPDWEQ